MEIQVTVKIKPFTVPNYVLVDAKPRPRDEGFLAEDAKYALKDLSSEILNTLCEDFKKEVFKKAGKELLPQWRSA